MSTSISRKDRILLETPLRSLQRGQLTPAAAVLVTRERGYIDLQLNKSVSKKRGAWVARASNSKAAVTVDRKAWQNLVREQGKQKINPKLRELKKSLSIHPVYILHVPLAVWQFLSVFSLIGIAVIFGHIFWLGLRT